MNRMRHDDILNLFESVGHCVLKSEISINKDLLVNRLLKIDDKYISKSSEVLATTAALIITKNI